jgi:hypothetical protein
VRDVVAGVSLAKHRYAAAVDKVNVHQKLASFDDYWVPKVIGELNGQYVKVVKFTGEGELCVVPRGVEHKPVAPQPCEVMLFEPASTRNTGAVDHRYTIEATDLEKI